MSLFTSILKRGVKFIPKKVSVPKLAPHKVTVSKAAPEVKPSQINKYFTTGNIVKTGLAGGVVVGVYGLNQLAGSQIDLPFASKKQISTTPNGNLPDIPAVPTGWTPQDMTNFFRGINPQDERVGGWEELGGGLGGAAEAIPKAVGKNILPLAVITGVIILITQRKPKRK